MKCVMSVVLLECRLLGPRWEPTRKTREWGRCVRVLIAANTGRWCRDHAKASSDDETDEGACRELWKQQQQFSLEVEKRSDFKKRASSLSGGVLSFRTRWLTHWTFRASSRCVHSLPRGSCFPEVAIEAPPAHRWWARSTWGVSCQWFHSSRFERFPFLFHQQDPRTSRFSHRASVFFSVATKKPRLTLRTFTMKLLCTILLWIPTSVKYLLSSMTEFSNSVPFNCGNWLGYSRLFRKLEGRSLGYNPITWDGSKGQWM